MTTANDLEAVLRRLDELESKAAIEQLMVAYMAAADRADDKGAHIAVLFTEDGRWDSVGPHGNPDWSAIGREALARKFDRNNDRMPFAAHFLTNGAIQLDGDTAVGRWMYFQACTYRGDQPLWIAGSYDNEFRRADGAWLMSHLRVRNFFTTPFDQGWVAVPHLDTP